jgi:raffinose/stachyose/melibiose transport system permease protein
MIRRLRRNGPHVAMVAPALIIFFTFFIVPLLLAVKMSLTNQSNYRPTTSFVGLSNYIDAVGDSSILNGVGNSVTYAVAVVLLQNIIALPVAVVLNSKMRGRTAFRAIFFSPAVLSVLVVGYLWSFILSSTDFGLANTLLGYVGLGPVNWLGSPSLALWSVIFTQVWQWFGYSMVIYLANLQSISPELYEAAQIDGAGRLQQFWHVTMPGLLPAIQINVVTGTISGLKVFDVVYAMTGGGPGDATETVLTLMYRKFAEGNYGFAAAFGVLFLIVTLCISGLLLGFFKKMGERL